MEPSRMPPPQETEAKLHFLDYWRIIRIRKAIIITVFLITAIIATAVTFVLPESYASTARIKTEPDTIADIQTVGNQSIVAPYDPYFIQTEFEIIQGWAVLSRVVDALNLNEVWGKKYFGGEPMKTSETVEFLKRRISLNPVRNTKLIDITVYGEDKDEAARLANTIAKAYREYRLDQRREMTTNGIRVLVANYQEEEDQITAMQTNVARLRDELRINDNDPNSLAPTPVLTTEMLHNLSSQEIERQQQYTRAEKVLTGLLVLDKEQLRDVLPTINPDSALGDLLSKLHESEQRYVTMTNTYGSANPDVVSLESLIVKLNEQIDARVSGITNALATQVSSEKAAFDALTNAVEQAKQRDQEDASKNQPYWDAKRQLANLIEFHRILAAKIEQEKLDLAIPKTAMVTITDPAEPGKDPVRPNKTLNVILGVVIGLVMGVGLAFFIEYLDTSVKTIDEVERSFQAPVLGVIPQDVGYLVHEGPENQHAEAYRVLRTNILFSRKDDKLNTIVIVSAGAGEGKSTTTLNLATVFAQAGQRVLIVDSDLRRPALHKLLHVGNNIGLTNYLLKQNTLEEVIQRTKVPTLDFMASGKLPSSSMGILSSAPMKDMITELKRRYDFVLFDSPPIMGVSDASILASEVDLAIQVIQYRRYPQLMSIRAKQLVEKVGGNLVGIVLNNINMSQDESYYYYSGYYHYDYYTRSEDAKETVAAGGPEGPGETGESGEVGGTDIKQKY